jgi:hypothetical protein
MPLQIFLEVMSDRRSLASLSLDLDNQWSYMKTHGDAGWEKFPSYLDVVVPRFLELIDSLGVKMTVFVVGQDAALEKNHAALKLIPEAGHEVGNHSFHHEPWLHLYSEEQLVEEISRAEIAIEEATGEHPHGWRGPGFSYSPTVLKTLAHRGYRYDASTFPTYLGPLARAYYFMTSGLGKKDREDRKQLFGKFREGFKSLKPYYWETSAGRLLEIPVTTTPFIKSPFHLSYLLYLATFSAPLARMYFQTALSLCRIAGVQPSLLLHPLDFLGADDVPELGFFPAMNRGGAWKMKIAEEMLSAFCDKFEVVPMTEHARRIEQAAEQQRGLPVRRPAVAV